MLNAVERSTFTLTIGAGAVATMGAAFTVRVRALLLSLTARLRCEGEWSLPLLAPPWRLGALGGVV